MNKPPVNGTPWGAAQSTKSYVPGVIFVSTASHGGFLVLPDAMKRAPAWLRSVETFVQRNGGAPGWFEEDCDAALVVLAFQDEPKIGDWGPVNLEAVKSTIRYCYPELATELGFGKGAA